LVLPCSGILIFVSLAEHYARIIADEGIAARVPQSEWQGAVDTLVAHISGGRIADGFITAIDVCGTVLETNFPRTETSGDELPDRTGCSMGRCHAKPDCRDSPGGALPDRWAFQF
jgi:uncharacterized membrane protein